MGGASRAQRFALSQMERRVAAYGDRPAGLTPEGALWELCHMKDLYNQDWRRIVDYAQSTY